MITKVIAFIEIIGGIYGAFSSLLYILNNSSGNYYSILSIIFLYVLTVFAGLFLYKDKNIGYYLSIGVNAIQCVYFLVNGFLYYFASLVSFYIMLNFRGNIVFDFSFGGKAAIAKLNSDSIEFGINIIPLLIIFILVSLYTKPKNHLNDEVEDKS